MSNNISTDWVSRGGWPVDTGRQVDRRLIKNHWSSVSCLYELLPCQSGSPWKQTNVSLKLDSHGAPGVNYWQKIIPRIWNLNTKTVFGWWSSLMNSRRSESVFDGVASIFPFPPQQSATIYEPFHNFVYSGIGPWTFFFSAIVANYFCRFVGIKDEDFFSRNHSYT